jgi:hypothetical protein
MDYLKAFGVEQEPRNEDDWTEEDDAAIADIIEEIVELENSDEKSNEDTEESDDPE